MGVVCGNGFRNLHLLQPQLQDEAVYQITSSINLYFKRAPIPLSATCLSLVVGLASVMTLLFLEPSWAVYSICSWKGRWGFPSMLNGGTLAEILAALASAVIVYKLHTITVSQTEHACRLIYGVIV